MSVATSVDNRDNIVRYPFPNINDLPLGLRAGARILKDKLDYSTYNHLLRDLAITHFSSMFATDKEQFWQELGDETDVATKRRKSLYGGALQIQKTNDNAFNMGVYNPDKISPVVYERMRMHAQISLSMAIAKMPIEHVSFSVDSDSQEVKALVDWNLRKIYPEMISDLLLGLDYGVSILEKAWVKIKNLILTTKNADDQKEVVYANDETWMLKTYGIHPTSYTLNLDKNGELLGIKQSTSDWNKPVTIKRRKLVVYTNDKEYGNYYGISRLKRAYTWWYWAEIVLQFMIRYLERRSSPSTVVTAPEGSSTDKDGNQVHNHLIGLQLGVGLMANSVGVLPYAPDPTTGKNMWDVKYLSDEQRAFMFVEVLHFFNTMISRSLWVLDNVGSQGGSTGTSNTTDTRTDVTLMIEEAVIRSLENIINTDVIPDIVLNNFPPERRAACLVTIEKLTVTRKLMLKELLMKVLGNINQFARDGALVKVFPDFKEMLKILEIPFAKIEDIINLDSWEPGGGGGDSDTEDDDITKEEKVDENNKDKKRSERSRIEKRKKAA